MPRTGIMGSVHTVSQHVALPGPLILVAAVAVIALVVAGVVRLWNR